MFSAPPVPPSTIVHSARQVVEASVVYFLAALFTIALTRFDGGVACLWIATPVLLARLVTLPAARWPAILIGCAAASFLATSTLGFGIRAAPFLMIVNVTEAALGAWLLRRAGIATLDTVPGVLVFLVAIGGVAPGLSALGGAAVATWLTDIPFWTNWSRWYAGHALGAITFTPIAILFLRGEFANWMNDAPAGRRVEAVLTIAAITAIACIVFAQSRMPLLFLPILPLVLATFRMGRPGAAITIVIVALVGAAFTLQGRGPIMLAPGTRVEHVQLLQFYIAVLVMTILPIAAELKRRARLFAELRESEARYRLVTENASDIVINIAVDGTINYVSPSIETIAGWSPPALIGTLAQELVHPDDRPMIAESFRNALLHPETTHVFEYRAAMRSGDYCWFEANSRGLRDDGGHATGVVSSVRDISKRKAAERLLTKAAATDPLTGLANRRSFYDAFDEAHADRRAAGTCVAVVDIDFFKRVNDTHGHDAGDRVLCDFARTALSVMRDSDTVARLGGEEFGILLRGASVEAATAACERLRRAVLESVTTLDDGTQVRITISIGIVSLAKAETRDAAMRAADAALYEAKHGGRNRLALAA